MYSISDRVHAIALELQSLGITPPAPEMSREDKLRASLTASKRRCMGGEVLVNDPNNMGGYMRRLRRLREEAESREGGEIPPENRYRTRFDPFA
jgi:hypothetical protein